MLSTQTVTRTIPWPEAGTVIMPVNAAITLATQCGCPYAMSVADFRKRAAEYTAVKATTPAAKYRSILMGTRIETVLLDQIEATDLQSSKRFHAQLSADSVLPAASARADAMTLPKGTDVYLKITDQNGKPYLGQTATQSAWLHIDYVVINGQNVPVKDVGATLAPGGLGGAPVPARGRAGQAAVRVIEAAGARKTFTVAEQSDINIDAAVAASPQPVAATQPSPAATSPAAPAGTGKAPAAAAPAPAAPAAPPLTPEERRAQQAADARQRAQKIAECRAQALKDHPEGGVALMNEYTECLKAK
jgi:hypothetical protein